LLDDGSAPIEDCETEVRSTGGREQVAPAGIERDPVDKGAESRVEHREVGCGAIDRVQADDRPTAGTNIDHVAILGIHGDAQGVARRSHLTQGRPGGAVQRRDACARIGIEMAVGVVGEPAADGAGDGSRRMQGRGPIGVQVRLREAIHGPAAVGDQRVTVGGEGNPSQEVENGAVHLLGERHRQVRERLTDCGCRLDRRDESARRDRR